ncbi:unnamed protein product [Prunus armeniaca]|uniref:Uncharacterized protein n=1 Tax=Prunus armeniaca TaxID=36596 RepID=A0A6J5TJK4_PRUAR|nr:unnamed protein product [Prunus armeniaca]
MAIGATCPATMARAMVVASCAGGCRPIMLEQVSRSTARLWLLPGLAAEATFGRNCWRLSSTVVVTC